jgi:prepilin-type N-terminal cleavage/methylation domain-containing protein
MPAMEMRSKWFGNNKGYTIIELITVLAIIGIIAAVAVPMYAKSVENAKIKSDKASAQIIAKAAEVKWLNDGTGGSAEYNVDEEMEDYFSQAPTPQVSGDGENSYKGFVAVVDENGKCIGVYYIGDGENYYAEPNLLTE